MQTPPFSIYPSHSDLFLWLKAIEINMHLGGISIALALHNKEPAKNGEALKDMHHQQSSDDDYKLTF